MAQWVRTFILAVIFVATFSLVRAAAQEPKTAETILARTAQTYVTCSSYQDTGIVVSAHFDGEGKELSEQPFRTWFVRPNFLRFEWTERNRFGRDEESGPSVVWSDGKKAYSSYPMYDYVVEEQESLGLAIA